MILTRVLARHLSPGGERGGLSVLIFHRVHARPEPLFPGEPDADRFDALLSWIAESFSVMSLDRAVDCLQAGTLPPRALSITFDDGYADNYTVALPLLNKHGMNATFFVASGFLNGGRMWNDTVIEAVRRVEVDELDLRRIGLGIRPLRSIEERRAAIEGLLPQFKYLPLAERDEKVAALAEICGSALPSDLMMTSGQLRALRSAGMTIGGHTRFHPILTRLDDKDAFAEIAEGKSQLEAILGEPVGLFAYPNGKPSRDYSASHAGMVRRAGFRAAVSTSTGMSTPSSDIFQLPRFTPWDRTRLRFGLRLINNMRWAGTVAT